MTGPSRIRVLSVAECLLTLPDLVLKYDFRIKLWPALPPSFSSVRQLNPPRRIVERVASAKLSNQHPVTNSEINRQCKILTETEGCLSNYTSRCMTDSQSEMVDMLAEGGLNTIEEFCKPQSKLRSTYLKYGDCINGQHKSQQNCMRDFQVSLEKAVDISWQNRLKLGCCAFNKLHACIRDAVEPKCGSEAYEMQQQLLRVSLSRLPTVTCAKYEHNSKTCGSLLPPAGSQPKGPKSHSVLSKLFSAYTGTH